MTGRLCGKRIFLTGAAQGIGLAIAEACKREGAALYLLDRDMSALADSAERLGGIPHMAGDISDKDAVSAAITDATGKIGPINALINNAGVNVFHAPLETSDDEWHRALDINVKGAWNCSKSVLPGMLSARDGVILNIASTHSFTIIPGTFPYPVAKHALLGLTRSLALEYAAQGIRVNALAPGYVETRKVIDWWNNAPDPETARAETMKLHPGGRIASTGEIAMAAVFLISDECPFINGACLVADGGLSLLQHP